MTTMTTMMIINNSELRAFVHPLICCISDAFLVYVRYEHLQYFRNLYINQQDAQNSCD